MSRRGNSKIAAGVQYFPFLAVLICTMGALVVLLLVTARQARSSAIAAAQIQTQALEADQENAAADRELAELRVAQLKAARDKTAAQLDDQRLKLSHLEDHLRRLREQFAGLRASAEELERLGTASDQQRGAVATELADLKTRIADAKRDLTTAETNAQNRQVSYSVIPYVGPNQTRRRPIYIECQLDSVVIQPEGITLYASDFEGPLGPGNPLAAALRAIREQVAAQEAAAGAEKSEPYPLLLVRPDGIVAYYAARTALASWASEFGYEMVEQDWNLEFPPIDQRLAEAARVALADAREKQKQIAASAPRHYPKNSKPTFHARPRGGFEQQGGPRGKNGTSGGDFPWDRSLAAGRGSQARRGASGTGIDESSDSETGNSTTGFAGGSRGAGNEFGSNGPSGSEPGTRDGQTNSGQEAMGDGRYGDGRYGDGRYGQPAGKDGTGKSGDAEKGIVGQAGAAQNTGARGSGSPGSTAQSGDGKPGSATGSAQLTKPTPPGNSTQTGGSTKGSQRSGSGSDQLPNPADVAMLRQTQPTGPQGSGASASNGGRQNGDSAYSGGTSSGGGSPSSGEPNSSGPGGASGQPGGAQDATDTPTVTAQLNKKKPASLAQSRGSDWGLPNAGNGSTAVTRPIVVELRTDRLVILPESGSGGGKTVPIVGDTHDCVDDLVSGVWQHMKSWGIAGRGLYWKPTLVMVVAPGAERHYAELEALLNDSGLEVKQRATKPPVANQSKTKRK